MPEGPGPDATPHPAPRQDDSVGSPWVTAARRGAVPIVLGVACLAVSVPATEDLDPLLRWVGWILVVLGLVIVVATGRTLSASR